MKPVAVALCATLLPTLLIIAFLIFLSISLYLRLRVHLRLPVSRLVQSPTKVEHIKEQDVGDLGEPFMPSLSKDASNPDWTADLDLVVDYVPTFGLRKEGVVDKKYYGYEWVKARLDDMGYDRAPAEVVVKWLQDPTLRLIVSQHIVVSQMLARADPENESPVTLLPFSPELRKSLCDAFHALEGIRCEYLRSSFQIFD